MPPLGKHHRRVIHAGKGRAVTRLQGQANAPERQMRGGPSNRADRSGHLAIRLPFGMLITTAFDFPGYETVAVQGEIFGLTVRARNIGSGCAAGLRSIFGGEIPQFTKLLAQSRNEAMARMIEEARMRGSNAIVAMRFDSGAIGQWSEICAYGTGVWIRPLSDVAKEQYDALVAAGQLPHQDTYQLRVSELQRTETVPGAPPR
jgi:uncharacterized protein YbjQ (UPF0145 family)